MSLKISPYGYGNPNAITVPDGREDIQYISNIYDLFNFNVSTNPNDQFRCKWIQKLLSERWSIIKQTQQTRFLFGISQVNFVNNFRNVYSNNNEFQIRINRTDAVSPSSGDYTIYITRGTYTTFALLMTELQRALNAFITALLGAGSFVVSLVSGYVNIVFIPPGGQTWTISVIPLADPNNTLTTNNINCYGLFGLIYGTSSSPPTPTNTIVAQSPHNLWYGLDTIFLTCDAVRWPFQYQSKQGTSIVTNNIQVLLAIPLNPTPDVQQTIKYDRIEFKETYPFPYSKNVAFSLVDKYGVLLESNIGYVFNATMRTQLLDAQDGAGQ